MKKIILTITIIIILLIILGGGIFLIFNGKVEQTLALTEEQETQIEEMIDKRRQEKEQFGGITKDPFDEKGIAKILFIGLDNRIGQTAGHCDAIQLIEINKDKQTITVTAVPRGTYSPLPRVEGVLHKETDYYISKACEVGGLDYGVERIERILGKKADYVVFLGFSQAMGIFRQLDLPANETMQWLRMRQVYKVGEPQRARNHSTFIKQMIIKFSPQLDSKVNLSLGYLLFPLIRTDLSLDQSISLVKAVSDMNLPDNPDKIILLMRPPYEVRDIDYEEEDLNENMEKLIAPLANIIPENAYSGQTEDEAQERLLNSIRNGLTDAEFVEWAFDNYLWLQIEDDTYRERAHYQILERYITLLENQDEQNQIISDYIIEMENLEQDIWEQQGRDLLESIN